MGVYDTESRGDERDVTDEFARRLRRHDTAVKYFAALAVVLLGGFGLRIVVENQFGQMFGAMIIWFSIIFGIGGVVITGLFVLQGKLRDLRR